MNWTTLVEQLEPIWSQRQKSAWYTLPSFPRPEVVQAFIDVAFRSSLQTEERRSVRFRILLAQPEEISTWPQVRHSSNPLQELFLREPLLLTPENVRRLAPAVDPVRGMIAVSYDDDVLRIWGIVAVGDGWWQWKRGEESPSSFGLPRHLELLKK